jgi:hypothetical protein
VEKTLTFIPAGIYNEELRSENAFDFEVSKESSSKGSFTITIRIQGSGNHKFSIRTNNLTIKDSSKIINLKSGGKITLRWNGKAKNADEPWVAVIVADNDLANHKELTGVPRDK